MADLSKLLVYVPSGTITGSVTISTIETASTNNPYKVYFVADTNEVLVKGVHFGLNNASAVKELKDAIGDESTASTILYRIKQIENSYVKSFGGATGDITLGAASNSGDVVFSMSGSSLTASVSGINNAAYKDVATTVSASSAAVDTKVATEKAVRTAVDQAVTDSKVTISTSSTTAGYLKSYTITQGTSELGKIDIPKDLVVQSGSVVKAYKATDGTISETNSEGATEIKALKLVIANQTDPIYVDVNDLVDKFDATSVVTKNEIKTTNSKIDIAAGTGIENAVSTVASLADANAKLIEDAAASSNVSDAVAGITVEVDQTNGKISKPVVSVSAATVTGTTSSLSASDSSSVITGASISAIKTYVDGVSASAVAALNTTADVTTASVADGVVTLTPGIKEENGIIAKGSGTNITLAKVATTGSSDDVTAPAVTESDSYIGLAEGSVTSQLATLSYWTKAAQHTKTNVVASSTNGNIVVDGSEVKVYAHPTSESALVAAVKVGRDSLGHVTLGGSLSAADITASAITDADKYALSAGTVGSQISEIAYALNVIGGGSIAIASHSASGSAQGITTTVTTENGGVTAVAVDVTAGSVTANGSGALTESEGVITAYTLATSLASIKASDYWEEYK